MRRSFPLLAILFLVGCSVPDVRYKEDVPGPHPDPAGDEFVRYDGYADVAGTLETSVTTWKRAAGGPTIRLVGAIHIADASYYERVQTVLGESEVVLFEVIKPESMDIRDIDFTQGDMYGPLAEAIGLASQMQSIDYRRDNFRWLDMSAERFSARLQEIVQRATERLSKMFAGGSSAIDFGSALRQAPPAVRRAYAALALQSPRLAPEAEDPLAQVMAILLLPLQVEKAWYGVTSSEKAFEDKYKHAVAGGLGTEDPAAEIEAMRGQDPAVDVLIDAFEEFFTLILVERNQVVVDGLKALVESGDAPADVAVWYGAAHNPGISEGLRAMGYEREEEPDWIRAIAIRK